MKFIGPILAIGLTSLVLVTVAVLSLLPVAEAEPLPTTAPVVGQSDLVSAPAAPPTIDMRLIEGELAQREAVYLEQAGQLEQAMVERQQLYQGQIEALNQQLSLANDRLTQLKAQEQGLLNQIGELEQSRSERLALYEDQLGQTREQYSLRFAELQAQLAEIQIKLAEANAQLGR